VLSGKKLILRKEEEEETGVEPFDVGEDCGEQLIKLFILIVKKVFRRNKGGAPL